MKNTVKNTKFEISIVTLVVTMAVALLLPATTFADARVNNELENVDFTTAAQTYTNGNWTFGEVFIPQVNLSVGYLGYYAAAGLGNFSSNHPVGLFDGNGDLLAFTTIDNASIYTSSSGHFAYNPISPVILFAGQTYVIEGVSNSDPYTWNDPGFTVYAPVTILGNNWVLGNGLNFNGTSVINDVADGYWGGNFAFATPEPGTLALFGSSVLGLGGLLRRRLRG
ncbi:MAG: PEP-CTERM sorting domain-containing protein [Candidatus Korobacteraceae bacterium]